MNRALSRHRSGSTVARTRFALRLALALLACRKDAPSPAPAAAPAPSPAIAHPALVSLSAQAAAAPNAVPPSESSQGTAAAPRHEPSPAAPDSPGERPQGLVVVDRTELWSAPPEGGDGGGVPGRRALLRHLARWSPVELGESAHGWVRVIDAPPRGDGWIPAGSVVPVEARPAAALLYRAELLTSDDPDARVSLPPGTLVTVLGAAGDGMLRVTAGEREGALPACVVTSDPAEIAIARALAARLSASPPTASVNPPLVSAARLAPLLRGGPVRPPTCGPLPHDEPERASSKRPATAGPPPRAGLEVLGVWTARRPSVDAPSVHDWSALAAAYAGVRADGALPAAIREALRLDHVAATTCVAEACMRPLFESASFDVPARVIRGAYYALTRTGAVRPSSVRLAGTLRASVDCDGCEISQRAFSGEASLQVEADAALVVWFPRDVAPGPATPLEWRILEPQGDKPAIELRMPGAAASRVYTFFGESRETITGPFQVRSAWTVTVPAQGTALRLVVVETNGNPLCERGFLLFRAGDTLERIAARDFDCDV